MNLKLILALLIFSQLIFSQERKINGVVKDSIGEAIAGANIVIEGTNRGTSTDIDGKYSIKVYSNEFLVFSFVGKKNQRIIADKNEINIQLQEIEPLKEEVGPAYYPPKPKRIDPITFKKLLPKTNQENFDYYVRRSNFNDFSNLSQRNRKWREISGDTLIYTSYFKGAVCDIPNEQNMKIRISNNTLYFDFGLANVVSDCERRFGVAGIMIDFVLNKKKYPNYKELNIEYIIR